MKNINTLNTQSQEYSLVVRQTAWVVLLILLVTLPIGQPQAFPMLAWIIVGAIGNALRYSTRLMERRWFASRVSLLAFDNLFVGVLLVLVGRVDMAYTGLLGLSIATATFWYGYRGMLAVAAGQGLLLAVAYFDFLHPYPALAHDPIRATILAGAVLLTLGFLLERLSHVRRAERADIDTLEVSTKLATARVSALLASTSSAVMILDSSGMIVAHNGALKELVSVEKIDESTVEAILPLSFREQRLVWREVLGGTPQHLENHVLKNLETGDVTLDITIQPIATTDGQPAGHVVVCKNVADQRSLNEQQASFIAIASHELRTPLTFIEAAISMALTPQNNLSDPLRSMLSKAHDNTMFMSRLVEDLTTLYMAQNDAIDLHMDSVDPKKLIEQVVSDYAQEAADKSLVLEAHVVEAAPVVVTTEYYVLQILRNLTSNAIKYTRTGTVTVSVKPSDEGGVQFAVRDSGIGISKKDQERLFTQFFQAEDYQTRESGGTGIGLYLCAQLARRINARLWAESELGSGSTFYFEVPALGGQARDHREVVAAGVNSLLEQI